MRKCKFLGYLDEQKSTTKMPNVLPATLTAKIISGYTHNGLLRNKIYNYKIFEGTTLFPYHIYNDDLSLLIATFSKSYFNTLFVDILTERKQKINKINEKSK